ncbi:MAG TPA: acetate/propionate family kinase [Mucilaginibacter sp.]|jgi:acetate kinase|nr:acetate/propionate family kinase [Mucilaginibacter sp.]
MTLTNDAFILAVNCGSSGLKFGLYGQKDLQRTLSGYAATDSAGKTHFILQDEKGEFWANHPLSKTGVQPGIRELIGWLSDHHSRYPVGTVVHRIVQGGPKHREPELVSEELLKELQHYAYLAPNHIPDEIKSIKAFQEAFPGAAAVVCFDTYFHKDLPDVTQYFPLPGKFQKAGLIRYGFHGLSYEFVVGKLQKKYPKLARKKLIIAHLGSGASMTAVCNGRSIDTTMGLSPLGGLVMGTRSGDLDPGVILYLLRKEKLSVDEIDELLSEQSGLKAIAGSGDMESLIKSSENDPRAKLAVRVFSYAVKKTIGALAAAMGGLDTLVFTGGIGENAPLIRAHCCEGLEFLGLKFSHRRNDEGRQWISKSDSKVKIGVLKTDEAAIMVKHARALISNLKHHEYVK